ncbi:MAG: hypothetical protein HYT11_04060 [Candidatus Levybacteria bacterium]|nr:hypothetical protein [Candidatus Levybacteria bacterium]
MKKHKLNMHLITIAALISSIILFSSASLAQEKGDIYQVSSSPEEAVVFETVKISMNANNPSDKDQSYLMVLQITKDGKLIHEEEFAFTLGRGKGIQFTSEYVPQDIGEHEAVIWLYDKFKTTLFDTQIIKFNVVSHLGPFDIEIEPLTTRIRPGLSLPAKILLENMGIKGVDAEIEIKVNCPDADLAQKLTFFVPAGDKTEKLIRTQVCDQEGLYNIRASIVLFNKTWVSSSSQFFVNSSYIELQFDPPENIKLNPSESYTFPVEVTNLGNQKITDLKFVVQRIPLAWQKVSPSSVIEVGPNEKAVFIVNITVPSDAKAETYEISMTAVAEETLERKMSTLEVASLATLPVVTPKVFSVISYLIISLVASATTLVTVGLMYARKKKRDLTSAVSKRAEIIKKIKETVKS